MSRLYVGLSGFSYKPWQGEDRFYPPVLKASQYFDYYASRFRSVEMDGTWYKMPSEKGVADWVDQAPAHFLYTFKAHRKVSHMARLKVEGIDPLAFMIKRLQPAIDAGVVGCVYIQLPPNLKRTDDRLEQFLPLLPVGPRYGIEFRHESWDTDEVAEVMRARDVAFVASDTDDRRGVRRDTGSFLYTRMRRESYSDAELDSWAEWFRSGLDQNKDVFVFFKHEDDGAPWLDADRLLARFS